MRDLAIAGDALYVLLDRALVRVAPGGEPEVLAQTEAGLGLRSLLAADDGGLYVLGTGDGGADLYFYDPGSGEGGVLAQNFDESEARVGADLFWGPDGALTACSAAGAIYSVDEMLENAGEEGYQPEPLIRPEADLDDVLACGWDEAQERYLAASARSGVLTLLPGEPDLAVDLLGDSYEIRGAAFY